MRLHRISLEANARTPRQAFGGQGGLYGVGRWHNQGRLVVYTAERVSLAMAEALVHLQRTAPLEPFVRWEIEVPDGLIAPLPAVPANWAVKPTITRAIGDAWLTSAASPALWIPSALVPQERNCLIHPAHPAFTLDWIVAGPEPFVFDPRLVGK